LSVAVLVELLGLDGALRVEIDGSVRLIRSADANQVRSR